MLANNIRLEPADYFSHIIDYDDWYNNQKVYKWSDTKWGPHTVDRFAMC